MPYSKLIQSLKRLCPVDSRAGYIPLPLSPAVCGPLVEKTRYTRPHEQLISFGMPLGGGEGSEITYGFPARCRRRIYSDSRALSVSSAGSLANAERIRKTEYVFTRDKAIGSSLYLMSEAIYPGKPQADCILTRRPRHRNDAAEHVVRLCYLGI